jgi:hypothetical protein
MIQYKTIQEIIDNSEPHPTAPKGRCTLFRVGDYYFSVVGGGFGLYGDFENTFELAIMDRRFRFVTEKLYPGEGNDIFGWLTKEELLKKMDEVSNMSKKVLEP